MVWFDVRDPFEVSNVFIDALATSLGLRPFNASNRISSSNKSSPSKTSFAIPCISAESMNCSVARASTLIFSPPQVFASIEALLFHTPKSSILY